MSQPSITFRNVKFQDKSPTRHIRNRSKGNNENRFGNCQNLSHLLKNDTKFFLKTLHNDYSLKRSITTLNSNNTSFSNTMGKNSRSKSRHEVKNNDKTNKCKLKRELKIQKREIQKQKIIEKKLVQKINQISVKYKQLYKENYLQKQQIIEATSQHRL